MTDPQVVATSREALAEAFQLLQATSVVVPGADRLANYLIDAGVVRVVDPTDPELLGRVIDEIADELHLVDPDPERLARAMIGAVTDP